MERAGRRHGWRQPVSAAVCQPMTGGTRYGVVPGEAHILKQPFPQGHPWRDLQARGVEAAQGVPVTPPAPLRR